MADTSGLIGVLMVAGIGWLVNAIRTRKQPKLPKAETTGVTSFGAFKTLLKTGNTDALADNSAIDPRFKTHYDRYIRPQVALFEKKRLKALAKLRKRMLAAIVILILCVLWGATHVEPVVTTTSSTTFLGYPATVTHSSGGQKDSLTGIGVLLMIATALWAWWPVILYKGSIKQDLFPNIFNFFGAQWVYDSNGIGNSGNIKLNSKNFENKNAFEVYRQFKQTLDAATTTTIDTTTNVGTRLPTILAPYMGFGILPTHDSASTQDLLRGDHRSVPLELLQCTLSKESGSGDDRSSSTVFHGLIITIDVPKRFAGHTVVKRDHGKIGNWLSKQFTTTLAPVHLEDPRFEERYQVYGSDQVEARYLLTNSFMERLITLEDLFASRNNGCCNIQCAFKDAKLLFTIPTDAPWFATGSIFKPADFISDINLILQQMDLLFAMIDVLKLDNKTGL